MTQSWPQTTSGRATRAKARSAPAAGARSDSKWTTVAAGPAGSSSTEAVPTISPATVARTDRPSTTSSRVMVNRSEYGSGGWT